MGISDIAHEMEDASFVQHADGLGGSLREMSAEDLRVELGALALQIKGWAEDLRDIQQADEQEGEATVARLNLRGTRPRLATLFGTPVDVARAS